MDKCSTSLSGPMRVPKTDNFNFIRFFEQKGDRLKDTK